MGNEKGPSVGIRPQLYSDHLHSMNNMERYDGTHCMRGLTFLGTQHALCLGPGRWGAAAPSQSLSLSHPHPYYSLICSSDFSQLLDLRSPSTKNPACIYFCSALGCVLCCESMQGQITTNVNSVLRTDSGHMGTVNLVTNHMQNLVTQSYAGKHSTTLWPTFATRFSASLETAAEASCWPPGLCPQLHKCMSTWCCS